MIDRWPTSAEALPFGTSAVAQIQQLAREVFENAFVLAMHPTAVVAIRTRGRGDDLRVHRRAAPGGGAVRARGGRTRGLIRRAGIAGAFAMPACAQRPVREGAPARAFAADKRRPGA